MVTKIDKLEEQADSLDQRLDRVELKQDLNEANTKGRFELLQAATGEVRKAVEALDAKMFKLIIALILALTGIKAVEMGVNPVVEALAEGGDTDD